jgi:hypothetical protein
VLTIWVQEKACYIVVYLPSPLPVTLSAGATWRVTDLVEIANKLGQEQATQRSQEPSRSTSPLTSELRPISEP